MLTLQGAQSCSFPSCAPPMPLRGCGGAPDPTGWLSSESPGPPLMASTSEHRHQAVLLLWVRAPPHWVFSPPPCSPLPSSRSVSLWAPPSSAWSGASVGPPRAKGGLLGFPLGDQARQECLKVSVLCIFSPADFWGRLWQRLLSLW